jgi:hypothetical protein
MTLFLLPTGYLASYPITYRLLLGSDSNCLPLFSSMGRVWQCREPSTGEIQRREQWQSLRKYCFPPAEWLVDHTPVQHLVIAFAYLVDTDEQIRSDAAEREFDRRLQVLLASGNRAAIVKMFVDFEPTSCSLSQHK